MAAFGNAEGRISIVFHPNTKQKQPAKIVKVSDKPIAGIAVSADGKLVAIGSNDNAIRILDTHSMTLIHEERSFDEPPLILTFSDDNNFLACSDHRKMRLIPLAKLRTKPISNLRLKETIASIAIRDSNDKTARAIIQSTSSSRVLVVPMDNNIDPYALTIPTLESITLSSDGQSLCGYDRNASKILVLRTDNPGEVVSTIVESGVEYVSFSPKKRCVVCYSKKGDYRNWSWNAISYDGSVLWQGVKSASVELPIFSDSGEFVAIGGGSNGYVVNASTGKEFEQVSLPMAFSFDDSHVASSFHLRYCFLQSRMRTETKRLVGHTDKVTYLHFSVDGKRLFTGCDDGGVRLWNTENGELLLKLYSFDEPVGGLDLSSDGKQLVAVSRSGQIRVFDAD